GTVGMAGLSSPLNTTSVEPLLIPALFRMSLSRTPPQVTFPIAPFSHCPPKIGGSKKLLPLPAHWMTAVKPTLSNFLRSSSDRESGLPTLPWMARRQESRSTEVGMFDRCQRTNRASFGVTSSLKYLSGVSSCGGLEVRSSNSPFSG